MLLLDIQCSGEQGFQLALQCALPAEGVTAIYGPSGSGKSTLLDCIAGLRNAAPGSEIRFGAATWQNREKCLPPWQRNIGYVFQDARLFPHLTVAGNLDYAANRASGPAPLARDALEQWLGLTPLLEQLPDTLSAGQRQRVAIGRALLGAPDLLLLDEPLANLDHAASRECLQLLQDLASRLELPVLYVSHDIEEVGALADHILLLENGRVTAQGPFLELASRLDNRLSHEEQAAAILIGEITAHDEAYGLSEIHIAGQSLLVNHLDQPIGSRRRVRIPARDVSVCASKPTDSSILNILPVTVSEIEQCTDARLLLRLALGDQYLLARITRKSAETLKLNAGDDIFAQIKSAALLSEASL
ncbi:molybdenum ABC transporter ATP-binding protein [Halioglobus sp. HI00S01]|uniref:molybdenum ABC transporter ATP-binding protein n=1 Tax=Halioglobus sp. HI00S01 TaxID=1822214 RepID=UPI0007C3909E|nr:molybdenum ABC transporter ATP-binding protein [Halioglobus sp. HI00S01]KZX58211.1 molybdenum ABC transporter ATP-binding protein [Halioglobus sp. HI00S01]